MIFFPTIDLLNGRAVRLLKGDYNSVTDYGDPMKVALGYVDSGAEYLHVVDLDAARGSGSNLKTIAALARHTGLKIELGGGVRSYEDVLNRLELGVTRVILGTVCVTDRELVKQLLSQFGGNKIVCGFDINEKGEIAVKGWYESAAISVADIVADLKPFGLKTIICTEIARDGTKSGMDIKFYSDLVDTLKLNVIASGGLASIDDIVNLKNAGVAGVISGRAVLDGTVTLEQALNASGGNK